MTAQQQAKPDHEHALAEIDRSLPHLPTVVRYHDDFADEVRTVRDLRQAASVLLELDGERRKIDLTAFGSATLVVKHVVADWLVRSDPHSVVKRVAGLVSYVRGWGLTSLYTLISAPIFDARSHWNAFAGVKATAAQAESLRALLHSLCGLSIGYWNPASALLVRALRSPRVDKYRAIRSGECFLPPDQQAAIVHYIDEICGLLARCKEAVDGIVLRDACILVILPAWADRSDRGR